MAFVSNCLISLEGKSKAVRRWLKKVVYELKEKHGSICHVKIESSWNLLSMDPKEKEQCSTNFSVMQVTVFGD
jgi:hypothetical protein